MISVKTENGRTTTEIRCKGLKEVIADTAVILKAIHEVVKEVDEDGAKEFEHCLDELTKDGIMFDEKRMIEETKRMEEEKGVTLEDIANNIIEALTPLAEAMKKVGDLKEEDKE